MTWHCIKFLDYETAPPQKICVCEKLSSILKLFLRHCVGLIYYFAIDVLKHHLKITMNRPSVFLSERKTENYHAKKTHPANPNLRRRQNKTTATQSFSTELRDWMNLQMQLCLSLVSPRGSTHHLYGSAPTKLYYISLQPSSPPFLSGLTLLSKQHLADTEQPEHSNWFFVANGSGLTLSNFLSLKTAGPGLLNKHCVCI